MAFKLNTPVEELDFTDETLCILKRAKINTLNDIVNRSEHNLFHLRGMDIFSFREIIHKIEELGLSLNGDEDLIAD